MNTRTSRTAFAATLAAAALVVAGCSSESTPTAPTAVTTQAQASASASDHNAADVAWTQAMIPHHRQAVEMADLVEGRTENPDLLALAAAITAAQGPEIAQMTGWLTEWGAPTAIPDADADAGHGEMDHGDTGHGGMMSAEQMAQLENATGPEFDRAWLEMMIAHHRGAVDSSEQIEAEGRSPQVRTLAEQIAAGQQAEIEQMTSMLGQ